jgi:hypothetical protein
MPKWLDHSPVITARNARSWRSASRRRVFDSFGNFDTLVLDLAWLPFLGSGEVTGIFDSGLMQVATPPNGLATLKWITPGATAFPAASERDLSSPTLISTPQTPTRIARITATAPRQDGTDHRGDGGDPGSASWIARQAGNGG